MANYYLLAVNADAQTLNFIEKVENIGARLVEIFTYSAEAGKTRFLPTPKIAILAAHAPKRDERLQAVDVEIDGVVIGKMIGSYYDGTAVGFDTADAAKVPPHSVVFPFLDGSFEEIEGNYDGATVSRLVREFVSLAKEGATDIICAHDRPVFFNDMGQECDLCIVKTHPMRANDGEEIIRSEGYAINPARDYTSPLMASEL